MKKVLMLSIMLLGFSGAYSQMNANAASGRARAAAQQAGCFDGINPALHGTITTSVDYIRVPCGPSISGTAPRVYIYAPTPCPPQAEICIQVIVPIAEVVFDCEGNPTVTCLSNGPIN
jgi:hypothetical protein